MRQWLFEATSNLILQLVSPHFLLEKLEVELAKLPFLMRESRPPLLNGRIVLAFVPMEFLRLPGTCTADGKTV